MSALDKVLSFSEEPEPERSSLERLETFARGGLLPPVDEAWLAHISSYQYVKNGKIVRVREHEDSRHALPDVPAVSRKRFVERVDDKRRTSGQTRSNFLHPETGAPMGKSEIGDTYEELFSKKGAHLVEAYLGKPGKYQRISGVDGGARNTPLDFRVDSSHAGELKTLSSRAANQKTAIKAEEIARKQAALKEMELKPVLLVQVVDQDTGTVHVYAYNAFASKAVKAMTPIGSYTYSAADFVNAQKATRHYDKRAARAAASKSK